MSSGVRWKTVLDAVRTVDLSGHETDFLLLATDPGFRCQLCSKAVSTDELLQCVCLSSIHIDDNPGLIACLTQVILDYFQVHSSDLSRFLVALQQWLQSTSSAGLSIPGKKRKGSSSSSVGGSSGISSSSSLSSSNAVGLGTSSSDVLVTAPKSGSDKARNFGVSLMCALIGEHPPLASYLSDCLSLALRFIGGRKTSLSSRRSVLNGLFELARRSDRLDLSAKHCRNELLKIVEVLARERNTSLRIGLCDFLLYSTVVPETIALTDLLNVIRKSMNSKLSCVSFEYGSMLGRLIARLIPDSAGVASGSLGSSSIGGGMGGGVSTTGSGTSTPSSSKNSGGLNTGTLLTKLSKYSTRVMIDDLNDEKESLTMICHFRSAFKLVWQWFIEQRMGGMGSHGSISAGAGSLTGGSGSGTGVVVGAGHSGRNRQIDQPYGSVEMVASFLRECVMLSRFDSTELGYVTETIAQSLLKVDVKDSVAVSARDGRQLSLDECLAVSHTSYVFRALCDTLDESAQLKVCKKLCELLEQKSTLNASRFNFWCLSELTHLISLVRGATSHSGLAEEIGLVCHKLSSHWSQSCRIGAARCWACLSEFNADYIYVWASPLIKNVSACLMSMQSNVVGSAGDLSALAGGADASGIAGVGIGGSISGTGGGIGSSVGGRSGKSGNQLAQQMAALHPGMFEMDGNVVALARLIECTPKLSYGVPDTLYLEAFTLALDLLNSMVESPLSNAAHGSSSSMSNINAVYSEELTVSRMQCCGWLLLDSLIRLGTSWAHDKAKTLFNLWREAMPADCAFQPRSQAEALSVISVRFAAYNALLSFVTVFESQIPEKRELEKHVITRLNCALRFDTIVSKMVKEKKSDAIANSSVVREMSRLRSVMHRTFLHLPIKSFKDKWVSLLKMCNAQFSYKNTAPCLFLSELLTDGISDMLTDDDRLVSRKNTRNTHRLWMSAPSKLEEYVNYDWMPHDWSELAYQSHSHASASKSDGGAGGGGRKSNANHFHTASMSPLTAEYSRVCPRLSREYIAAFDCDASVRLFCRLFPFQTDAHREQLIAHYSTVTKTAKSTDHKSSEELSTVLHNSAAVILGCVREMCKQQMSFGKCKVRTMILKIAFDYLHFRSEIIRRAAAELLGTLAWLEDSSFRSSLMDMLSDDSKFKKTSSAVSASRVYAMSMIVRHLAQNYHNYIKYGLLSSSSSMMTVDHTTNGHITSTLACIDRLCLMDQASRNSNSENPLTLWTLVSLHEINECCQYRCMHNLMAIKECYHLLCKMCDICMNLSSNKQGCMTEHCLLLMSQLIYNIIWFLNKKMGISKKSKSWMHLLSTVTPLLVYMMTVSWQSVRSSTLRCIALLNREFSVIVANDNDDDSDSDHSGLTADGFKLKRSLSLITEMKVSLLSREINWQLCGVVFAQKLFESAQYSSLTMDSSSISSSSSSTDTPRMNHSQCNDVSSLLFESGMFNSLLFLVDCSSSLANPLYIRAYAAVRSLMSVIKQRLPQTAVRCFSKLIANGVRSDPVQLHSLFSNHQSNVDSFIRKLIRSKSSKSDAGLNNYLALYQECLSINVPRLEDLRYTSFLWLLTIVDEMIRYCIKEGGKYMDVAQARADSEETHTEYLILSMPEVVSLVVKGCTAKHASVRQQGLNCLNVLIHHFVRIEDPEAGIKGVSLLDQFQAEFEAALRGCISTESDPSVRMHSVKIVIDYMSCPLCVESSTKNHVISLLTVLKLMSPKDILDMHQRGPLKGSGTGAATAAASASTAGASITAASAAKSSPPRSPIGTSSSFSFGGFITPSPLESLSEVYESHVRTSLALQYLRGLCSLYNGTFMDVSQTQESHHSTTNVNPSSFTNCARPIHRDLVADLLQPKLLDLCIMLEMVLLDFAVLATQTKKSLRSFKGFLFVGSDFKRVRSEYVAFAKVAFQVYTLMRDHLKRLTSETTKKKKNEEEDQTQSRRVDDADDHHHPPPDLPSEYHPLNLNHIQSLFGVGSLCLKQLLSNVPSVIESTRSSVADIDQVSVMCAFLTIILKDYHNAIEHGDYLHNHNNMNDEEDQTGLFESEHTQKRVCFMNAIRNLMEMLSTVSESLFLICDSFQNLCICALECSQCDPSVVSILFSTIFRLQLHGDSRLLLPVSKQDAFMRALVSSVSTLDSTLTMDQKQSMIGCTEESMTTIPTTVIMVGSLPSLSMAMDAFVDWFFNMELSDEKIKKKNEDNNDDSSYEDMLSVRKCVSMIVCLMKTDKIMQWTKQMIERLKSLNHDDSSVNNHNNNTVCFQSVLVWSLMMQCDRVKQSCLMRDGSKMLIDQMAISEDICRGICVSLNTSLMMIRSEQHLRKEEETMTDALKSAVWMIPCLLNNCVCHGSGSSSSLSSYGLSAWSAACLSLILVMVSDTNDDHNGVELKERLYWLISPVILQCYLGLTTMKQKRDTEEDIEQQQQQHHSDDAMNILSIFVMTEMNVITDSPLMKSVESLDASIQRRLSSLAKKHSKKKMAKKYPIGRYQLYSASESSLNKKHPSSMVDGSKENSTKKKSKRKKKKKSKDKEKAREKLSIDFDKF